MRQVKHPVSRRINTLSHWLPQSGGRSSGTGVVPGGSRMAVDLHPGSTLNQGCSTIHHIGHSCEQCHLELCSEAALPWAPPITLGKSVYLTCLSTPFDGWSLDSPGEPVGLQTRGSIPWRFPFNGFKKGRTLAAVFIKNHPTLTSEHLWNLKNEDLNSARCHVSHLMQINSFCGSEVFGLVLCFLFLLLSLLTLLTLLLLIIIIIINYNTECQG